MALIFPTQFSEFVDLKRAHGCVYIDKTRQIADMVPGDRPAALFLARPRRFGKTLLLSILEALFQGQRQLFEDTWLGQSGHWDWAQPPYPVIRLDMALAPGRPLTGDPLETATAVAGRIQRQLERLYREFSIPLPGHDDIADLLGHLIYSIRRVWQRKTVVLMDEYDAPITQNMEHPDVQEEILRLMHAFYGTLKRESIHIHFTFMTGITRVARTGLFSGANHFADLSFDPSSSTLLGYTQADLHNSAGIMAGVEVGARHLECSPQALLDALEYHYNGYQFSAGGEPVYNPFSLNSCLNQLQNPAQAKNLGLDHLPNFWAESGTPRFLFGAWHQNLATTPADLMQVDIRTVEKINFNVAAPDLATLMYQSGYLTRKQVLDSATGTWQPALAFPNREVELTYRESFLDWLREQTEQWQATGDIPHLFHHLHQAVQTRGVQEIHHAVNAVLTALPYVLHVSGAKGDRGIQDYEVYYQSLLFLMLSLVAGRVEVEGVVHRGRFDLGVTGGGHILIFELKVNGNAEQAVRQAMARQYASPWQDGSRPVTVLGLNFNSSTRRLANCVKWELGFFVPETQMWNREPFQDIALASLQLLDAADRERFAATCAVDWPKEWTYQPQQLLRDRHR